MEWSESNFRIRVEKHARRAGLTLTDVLTRAGLTEDYLRHKPAKGRNVAGIYAIAEVLEISPAALMGFELLGLDQRSALLVANVVKHLNLNIIGSDIAPEQIALALSDALKQHSPKPRRAKGPPQNPA